MKKVINTKVLDDIVVEIEVVDSIRQYPYSVKKINVDKNDLQTPITKERLHAAQPWNKTRPKGVK